MRRLLTPTVAATAFIILAFVAFIVIVPDWKNPLAPKRAIAFGHVRRVDAAGFVLEKNDVLGTSVFVEMTRAPVWVGEDVEINYVPDGGDPRVGRDPRIVEHFAYLDEDCR
jgi:hypothetical protein